MNDQAYDDGSEVEVECEPDEPPSSGEWVDPEEYIHNPLSHELVEGERLGNEIDIDDDEDNGMPGGPGEIA